jgi:mRNA interferase RelE/StbE
VAYTLLIKASAQRELVNLPNADRHLVENRIAALADNPWPNGCKPLRGNRFKGLYRIRSGDYRIIYQVQNSELIVLVVKVGNRKDVYD